MRLLTYCRATNATVPMAEAKTKPVQDRFVAVPSDDDAPAQPVKATKTAEAQTGGVVPAAAADKPEK